MVVVHEDDQLVAVNKPAGMSVHGGAGETGPTLIDILKSAYLSPDELHLANRLDKATSGLVLVAKSAPIAAQLAEDWERAEKKYLAVALGRVRAPQVIEADLEDKYGAKRSATTRLEPIAYLEKLEPKTTLVALFLGTGRTHQIRLHLKALGHPVLLDDKHGDFRANKAWIRAVRDAGGPRPKSLMLHASRLTIDHPNRAEDRRVSLRADPPAHWQSTLAAAGLDVDGCVDLS